MELRDYQTRAISELYEWFNKNPTGHPVINMPGGSGKSVVIASIVKDALQNWPETRVLMLVSSKELVDQNSKKLRQIWPNAPMGVCSASLGRRELGEPITYAGIGSVHTKSKQIGHIDICLIDEVHMCSTNDEGMYRNLIRDLLEINPDMRIIGFSASPYRLGHGMITDGPTAIFTDILEPVSIEELIYKNHLVPLRSKLTQHKLETTGLHKRGGEWLASEMEQAFNTDVHNMAVAQEIMQYAADRNHWLIFCSGVDHAKSFAACLNSLGVSADYLTTPISKTDRERKLADFESGKTRAMCNVGILTTGYDFPALDCIAFLRSTMSPGLYLQMAVRGMRPYSGKTDCMVLDFAGVVQQHGPITAIQPPRKPGDGQGEAPVKSCEKCWELVHISAKVCPACGEEFPVAEPEQDLRLRNDDIMGDGSSELAITSWQWRKHISRTSSKEMLAVTYYGSLNDKPIREYFPVTHIGYAGEKALNMVGFIASKAGVSFTPGGDLVDWAETLNAGSPPSLIKYKMDGKYHRVISRSWTHATA